MLHPRGEDLLAVDDPAVAFPAREGGGARGVAAGVRLGHRHRLEPEPPGGDLGQVAALLGFRPVAQQGAHGVHLRVAGGGVPAAGVDLLQDQAGLHQSEPAAAVVGRDQQGEPAARCQGLDELLRIGSFRVEPAPVSLREAPAELPDRVPVLPLLVAEREVHQRRKSRGRSGMAAGAEPAQPLDLVLLVAGGGEDLGAIAVQGRSRAVGRLVALHLDR
jgi:hypothetical protein